MPERDEQTARTFEDSPLTARLSRRVREPLGVIDVRHPERLQARSAAWIGQRTEMLDKWKSRYGMTAPDKPAERTLTTSPQTLVMRSVLPRIEAPAEAPAPGQFRVKRPAEVREANAPGETPATVANLRLEPAEDHRSLLSSVETSPGAVAAGTPHTLRQLPQSHSRETRPDDPPGRVEPAAAPGPLVQAQHATTTSPAVAPAARMAAAASAAAAAPVQRSPELKVLRSGRSADLVLRRKATDPSEPIAAVPIAGAGFRDAASPLRVAPGAWLTASPGVLPLVLARSVGSPASSQVMPATAPERPGAPPSTGTRIETAPRHGVAAVAPETPAPRTLRAEAPIVWRKSEPAATPASGRAPSPPISAAPNMQIMRSAVAGSSSFGSGSATSVAVPQHRPSQGADVEHLAERVSRLLARQMTVERERRGMAP